MSKTKRISCRLSTCGSCSAMEGVREQKGYSDEGKGGGGGEEEGDLGEGGRGDSTASYRGDSTASCRGDSTASYRGDSTASCRGDSTASCRGDSTASCRGDSTASCRGDSTASCRGRKQRLRLSAAKMRRDGSTRRSRGVGCTGRWRCTGDLATSQPRRRLHWLHWLPWMHGLPQLCCLHRLASRDGPRLIGTDPERVPGALGHALVVPFEYGPGAAPASAANTAGVGAAKTLHGR
jgi:hypothetical protein